MMLQMDYAVLQEFDNALFTWQGTIFEVYKPKINIVPPAFQEIKQLRTLSVV